jgi:predicted phosphoribosyltransferase
LVCAVPVGPGDTLARLALEADEVVCPLRPARFFAVGEWYVDFSQTSDAEVERILEAHAEGFG